MKKNLWLGIDLSCYVKSYLLLALIIFFSWLVGDKNFICCYCTFIDSICCGYLNPIQSSLLPFYIFTQHQIFSNDEAPGILTEHFLTHMGHQVLQVVCHTKIFHSCWQTILVVLKVFHHYQIPPHYYPFKNLALIHSDYIFWWWRFMDLLRQH